MSTLCNKRIVIIGGSSGIGFAVAQLALEEKANIIIASRSNEKLEKAKKSLGKDNKVNIQIVDIRSEQALHQFFNEIGKFDHLQISASDVESGPIATFPIDDAKKSFDSKFWGPYMAVKHAAPFINKGGSITLYSGGLSQRPWSGSAVSASINGAVESLGRALAAELAPIRVNTISPGLTDTAHFDKYNKNQLKKFFASFCEKLLIKRPAQPKEIAEAAIYLMKNTYVTGSTLYVDGGYTFK